MIGKCGLESASVRVHPPSAVAVGRREDMAFGPPLLRRPGPWLNCYFEVEMLIGLISDTHDFLDPRVPSLFKGVEHILHAGDIGRMSILVALERIAPVTAVLGNTDAGLDVRETEVIELAGRKFLLHH